MLFGMAAPSAWLLFQYVKSLRSPETAHPVVTANHLLHYIKNCPAARWNFTLSIKIDPPCAMLYNIFRVKTMEFKGFR